MLRWCATVACSNVVPGAPRASRDRPTSKTMVVEEGEEGRGVGDSAKHNHVQLLDKRLRADVQRRATYTAVVVWGMVCALRHQ